MAKTAKNTKPIDATPTTTSPMTNPPKKKSTTTKKNTASKNTKTKPKPAPRGARAAVGAPKAKATTEHPAKTDATRGRVGALEGAYEVLKTATEPMSCKALVETMAQRNIWSSPSGKTPHATLYAAITREIADKGRLSRFAKAGRGLFALAKKEAGGGA
ncbi:MAG: hypothetical protein H6812_10390 [Phycisphaeraceae bacterium]|nr:hypothetical protein [Phycisphaeraceae bacterium]